MTVSVLRLFLTVPWISLQCGIVVSPDHTHLLFSDTFYSGILVNFLSLQALMLNHWLNMKINCPRKSIHNGNFMQWPIDGFLIEV